MPGARNAQYLVGLVRDHIQHISSQGAYRDGFAADATAPDGTPSTATPILRWLNRAFNEMTMTGFCKSVYTFPTTPGGAEYELDPSIGEIYHVTINGQALTSTTLLGQDRDYVGWQAPSAQPGLPQRHYSYSDIIGFDPVPDQIYTVQMVCDTYPPDLVLPIDVPQRLPSAVHEYLADRAAWWLCNTDAENPAAKSRMPALQAAWVAGLTLLQQIVDSRELDRDFQIEADDYRRYFRRGGDG